MSDLDTPRGSGMMNECYLNPGLCAECSGKCCKRMPGSAFPEDFTQDGDLQIVLEQAFKSGNWVIDWWEGDPRGYEYEDAAEDAVGYGFYVRPRIITEQNGLYHASWGGQCVFLTPTGCALEPSRRPQQCRMLEPIADDKCIIHSPGTKHDAAIAWLPYHAVIMAAAKEVDDAAS